MLKGGTRHRLKVDVSLYLHATEDEDKVVESLGRVLGIGRDELVMDRTSGHHGNPVVIVRATLVEEKAMDVLRELVARMDEVERERLSRSLEDIIDERGRIYIRLDKQGLVLGKVRIGRKDPVELVVSSGFRKEEPALRLAEILGAAKGEGVAG